MWNCGYLFQLSRCSLSTAFATWPTFSTASASLSLAPAKLKNPLSEKCFHSHILGKATLYSHGHWNCEALNIAEYWIVWNHQHHRCHHLYHENTRDSLKTVAASRDGQRRTALISLLIAFFFFQVKDKDIFIVKTRTNIIIMIRLQAMETHYHHHYYNQTASNGEQDILFLFLKDTLGFSTAGSLFKTFYGFRLQILLLMTTSVIIVLIFVKFIFVIYVGTGSLLQHFSSFCLFLSMISVKSLKYSPMMNILSTFIFV